MGKREDFIQAKEAGYIDVVGGYSELSAIQSWELYMAILPTPENLQRAKTAIANIEFLFGDAGPAFKLLQLNEAANPCDGLLNENGIVNDLRGQELVLTIPHHYDNHYAIEPETIKNIALHLWRECEAEKVQLAYLPPAGNTFQLYADPGIVTPFTYAAAHHAETFDRRGANLDGVASPMNGLHITAVDLDAVDIEGYHGHRVLARQAIYGLQHFEQGLEAIKAKLDALHASGQSSLVDILSPLAESFQEDLFIQGVLRDYFKDADLVVVNQTILKAPAPDIEKIYYRLRHAKRALENLQRQHESVGKLEAHYPSVLNRLWTFPAASRDDLIRLKFILSDYTKNNRLFTSFLHGDWNHHYVRPVSEILNNLLIHDDFFELLTAVNALQIHTPNGRLADTLAYIIKHSNDFEVKVTQLAQKYAVIEAQYEARMVFDD